jgi:sporadic carbohydrate cluster protein (TIGR04323 family)
MLRGQINVKGYATPRQFSGFQIPIPLQSAAIRRYCDERGLVFNHHVVENVFPGTFLVLERIVAEAHLFQAMAMCSISMLPNDSARRTNLLDRCVNVGMTVHFLFESLIVSSREDIAVVDELLSLTGLLKDDLYRVRLMRDFLTPE